MNYTLWFYYAVCRSSQVSLLGPRGETYSYSVEAFVRHILLVMHPGKMEMIGSYCATTSYITPLCSALAPECL